MVLLFLIIALVIAILGVFFALQNSVAVAVSFLIWKFESSLALVILLSLALGIVVSFLLSIPATIRRNVTISRCRKRIQELEEELQEREGASQNKRNMAGSQTDKR
jgi:uncharacterized integral membrane protein